MALLRKCVHVSSLALGYGGAGAAGRALRRRRRLQIFASETRRAGDLNMQMQSATTLMYGYVALQEYGQ